MGKKESPKTMEDACNEEISRLSKQIRRIEAGECSGDAVELRKKLNDLINTTIWLEG